MSRNRGFSLLELVLVVLLLTILAGSLAPSVTARLAQARDARRLADLQTLVGAIEQYKLQTGDYPVGDARRAAGGWDVSNDGAFLPELVREGFLRETLFDPRDDGQYFYAYQRYPADAHGCVGGPFFVLGIKRLESGKYESYRRGLFRCSGRDWNEEFAYVTGGGTRAR